MKNKFLKYLLFPLSLLYGAVVWLRNYFFDIGLLRQQISPIFTICVGNLSVGGTGKTPHVEYLTKLLSPLYPTAVLSRGYGRKTKGFILANSLSDSRLIGDEPCQYSKKFPDITVAVCEKRIQGLQRLSETKIPPKIVILDDAFQHRYVKPDFSILLTDYQSPFYIDWLLPSGCLRENRSGAKRANVVIITKAPPTISKEEKDIIIRKLKLTDSQTVFFSFIEYGLPVPLTKVAKSILLNPLQSESLLLFTGIANPQPLLKYLEAKTPLVETLTFPDHHRFTEKDLQHLKTRYQNIPQEVKAIITTEKDAMRLSSDEILFLEDLPVFYIPIQVNFQNDEKEKFNEQVLSIIGNIPSQMF